jgi:hypothetical protein
VRSHGVGADIDNVARPTDDRHVDDSGQPGAAARDGVSPLFIDAPQGKPSCRDLSSNAFGNGYFTLAYGVLAVEGR